jgi:hypothetical protein
LEDAIDEIKSLLTQKVAVGAEIDDDVTKSTVFFDFGMQITCCI